MNTIALVLSVILAVSCGVLGGALVQPAVMNTASAIYRAEDLAGASGSLVQSWQDVTGNGLDLSQSNGGQAPVVEDTAELLTGRQVRFDNGDNVHIGLSSLSQLVSATAGSFYAVMKHNSADGRTDLFGAGDCVSSRFLAHVPWDGVVAYQFGDPNVGGSVATIPGSGFSDDWKVLFGTYDGSTYNLWISDEFFLSSTSAQSLAPIINFGTTLFVGNSACNNGYTGSIAEIGFFNFAVPEASAENVIEYLTAKYGI